MSNEVTKAAQHAVAGMGSFETLQKLAPSAQLDRPTPAGGDTFLRLGRDGIWIYGQENTEIQPGSLWAINPMSLMRGYVCWTDYGKGHPREGQKNEKLGEVMVPLGAQRPAITDLEQFEDKDTGKVWSWNDMMSVKLVCLTGEDKGTELSFPTSSVGGVRLLNAYYDEMLPRATDPEHPDFGKPVAVVKLESDHYPHKVWGKIYTPVFDYVEWKALDDSTAVEGEAAETSPAGEGEAPKPTRSRRRPAA